MRPEQLKVSIESWPLAEPFRISRGAKTTAEVIVVEISHGAYSGRGEGCPYARYGETAEGAVQALQQIDLAAIDLDEPAAVRRQLLQILPAGSVRNAFDCALWDLEAKMSQIPAWQIAGLNKPEPLVTCYTLSIDAPVTMAAAALKRADCPLLKLKLADPSLDCERLSAVRRVRPDARLVADANEAWSADDLPCLFETANDIDLELIEQPLPAAQDAALEAFVSPIPLCADESAPPGSDITALIGRYQAVNIKLDKTGGLTAGLAAARMARRLGLRIMIGSMVSTSLAMAPAALLGSLADWVDLDSPLLLAQDREHAMVIENGRLLPATSELWG